MSESPASLLKQFKPALTFLGIFLAVYLVGNTLYGVWIDRLGPVPDFFTHVVTRQSAALLTSLGTPMEAVINPTGPTVFLQREGDTILNVYEGCNGINVMIVFLAFVFAYGGSPSAMSWFIPVGLVLIHAGNLVRVMLLYAVVVGFPDYFYYVHKYLFTASLYVAVLVLWWWWVRLNRVTDGQ